MKIFFDILEIINHFDEPCGTGRFEYIGSCAKGLYCWKGLCTNDTDVDKDNTDKPLRNIQRIRSTYSTSTRRKNWMKDVPDETYLGTMSIPGTHDTMTASSGSATNRVTLCGQCHSKTLTQQLEMGIRFLDIRLRCYINEFWLYHGSESIGITFKETLKRIKTFLRANRGETVIMSYQDEHTPYKCDDDKNDNWFSDLFKREWETLHSSMRYSNYDNNCWPKLKDTRGKVVLWRQSGKAKIGFKKNNGFENTWEGVASFYGSITEQYKKDLKTNIEKSMKYPTGKYPYITYLSASDIKRLAWLNPLHIAKKINPYIKNFLSNLNTAEINTKKFGVVAMDFPSNGLVDEIIKRNPLKGKTYNCKTFQKLYYVI